MTLGENRDSSIPREESEQTLRARVYTEVSPARVQEILQGKYESSIPPKYFPSRWYTETVLDYFEPPHLREEGVGRLQAIFTSPIPYQGGNPIQGRELLVLEVSSDKLYVAEADYVSKIITPTVISYGILERIILLKTLGFPRRTITRQEFEEKFNALPEQQRAQLIALSEEQARRYWESVVSYREYTSEGKQYYEPEILMTSETQIFSARKAS